MATGTDAGGTWNTTAGNKTVVATPAANDLIVVVHGMSGWAAGDSSTVTDNNADGLGTYYRLGDATTPLSNGGGTNGALWISIRNALVGSATSTTFTVTNTGDTGGGLTVLRFSGMSRVGSQAVKQSIGESSATENPPTITFSATTLTANPVILAVMGEDNPAGVTPPTGFTEADDTGWATPTAGIEVCWDDSGNTATLVSWSGGALTDHNEVGIELDTSAAPTARLKDIISRGVIAWLREAVRVRISDQSAADAVVSPAIAAAGYKIDSDGIAYTGAGSPLSGSWTPVSNEWMVSGANTDYEVRLTVVSGDTPSGTVGSWLATSTDRDWSLTVSGGSLAGTYLVEIRDASTLAVLDSMTLTLEADST